MKLSFRKSRRQFIKHSALGLSASLAWLAGLRSAGAGEKINTKVIPSRNEAIPVIGLGSSRTFNVGNDLQSLNIVSEVMRHFFLAGGTLIDSSPMYGSSQPAIGYGLEKLGKQNSVFSADKVWTWEHEMGPAQIEQSRKYWKVDKFDLMQVHNLVAWEEHLALLNRMKQQGQLKYNGITTSHGRRHSELLDIMRTEQLDFVQLSYNILDREAEEALLPLAQEKGIAIIVNRPFQRGELIEALEAKPLPAWVSSIDCKTWPQFLLKFVVSHPAVTCAIPATSQVEHVKENMQAAYGAMPDAAMRKRMIEYVEKII